MRVSPDKPGHIYPPILKLRSEKERVAILSTSVSQDKRGTFTHISTGLGERRKG